MAQFVTSAIVIVTIIHLMLGAVAYGVLLERKVAAWVQDRLGPNRVGPRGLLQPIADGVKLLFKEDFAPAGVDRPLFTLAPLLAIVPAFLAWAIIPWGGYLQIGDSVVKVTAAPINIGIVFVLAVGSLAVYGVVIGGYASNNKYSFFGGLRATAQMLSYEIPLGLSVLIVILMAGTVRADYLVNNQVANGWYLFHQPLLAIILFTCTLAECNRTPFDLAECEQELVGGYLTEYSSMRLSLFLMGEYVHMITGCAVFALLFLGGWSVSPFNLWPDLPLIGGIGVVLIKFAVFAGKVFVMLFLMMVIRWTIPRFRFDQLMRLAWRTLIPVTIILLLITGTFVFVRVEPMWLWCLSANLIVFVCAAMFGSRLPQGPPVNRRVPLEGSRFSPPAGAPSR